jgi:hypothetical protein
MDFDYVVIPALVLLVGTLLVWLSLRRILSLSTKNCPTWRKVTERIVLSVAALACAAVAASASFNAVSWEMTRSSGAESSPGFHGLLVSVHTTAPDSAGVTLCHHRATQCCSHRSIARNASRSFVSSVEASSRPPRSHRHRTRPDARARQHFHRRRRRSLHRRAGEPHFSRLRYFNCSRHQRRLRIVSHSPGR